MAWHVQRPRGLERGGEPRELGELQRVLGAAEVTGAQPPQSSCWMTVAPPQAPCHLLASASSVFVLPQSRGPSSTHCPARATDSVSPAWTPTRCPLLPHSSWTSCFTPTGREGPLGGEGLQGGPRRHESAYKPQSEGKHRPALGANPKGEK